MTALTQVVKTKITLPRRRPHLLTRNRLLTVLDKIHDYRIVIVVAPAGYGKSSLLIDFAHSSQLKTCWYAIDPLDNNPLRFLNHFVASIQHQFPDFGSQTQSILNEQVNIDQDYVDRLLVSLVNDIYEQITEPMIIMVDDYHLVGKNQLINYFVGTFVQFVDEDCHLVVTSRASVDLPELALMIGRTQITGLGMSELAFSSEEIETLFRDNLNLKLGAGEAETLAQDAEGWITGVLLSAQTKAGDITNNLYQARLSGIDVHDYLAQQTFDQQSPTMQRFLLHTALLQEFNAERCQHILGPLREDDDQNWPYLIDQLGKNNLFVTWVDAESRWLRYHHLFQEFLEQKAIIEIPEEREQILRYLGDMHTANEKWQEAYSNYSQIDQKQTLVNLIKKAGLPLIQQGQFNLLKSWLDGLSEEYFQSEPLLISLGGTVEANLGQVESGLQLQNLAITLARKGADQLPLIQILLDRAVIHRDLANYEAALTDLDEALMLCGQTPNLSLQADGLRLQGTVLHYLGQFDRAVETLEQSLAIYQVLNQPQNIAAVRLELGIVYSNLGHFEKSSQYNNQAYTYWLETNNLAWQANLCNNQGVIHFLRGDYLASARVLEAALAAARRSGLIRFEAFALTTLGDVFTDLGGLDAAQTVYDQAIKLARQRNDRFLLLYLSLALANIAQLNQAFHQAEMLRQQAHDIVVESSSTYEQGIFHLRCGEMALQTDDYGSAITSLKQAADRLLDQGYQVESMQTSLFLAAAYCGQKNPDASREYLDQAIAIAAEMDSPHPLTVTGFRVEKSLLADVSKMNDLASLKLQVDKFKQDRARLRRELRQQISTVSFDRPQITIRTLGKMQVQFENRVISNNEWLNQPQMRELFFYLLLHPTGLSKDDLDSNLWPDSSESQLKRKVRNTIYRLRRTLETDIIVFDNHTDLYQFNRNLDYDFDAENFRNLLLFAENLEAPHEQRSAYEKAVDCYQGPFLPHLDGSWVWPEREALAKDFLNVNLKLAQLYQSTRIYDAALACYERILREEPAFEKAYRASMRIQADLGNRLEVARLYERCQSELEEEVGVPVSPQTQDLYKRLMQ